MNVLALLGVTVVGFSQIFFDVILGNAEHFPRGAGFHAWTLFWTTALPALVLVGGEAAITRCWGRERAFRAWRALLYGLLAASFARQLEARYAEPLDRLLPLEFVFPLILLLGGAAGWAAYRSRVRAHRLAACMGVLGVILAGRYAVGVWGPAWRAAGESSGAASVKGEGTPVWILLCDELSYAAVANDGGPDPDAFPALAELARGGLWFTDATTNHQWTRQAVPALLSGRRDPPEGTPTLFQRLPASRSALIIDPWLPTTEWIRRYGADKTRLHFRSRAELLEGRPLGILRHLGHTFAESAFVRLPAGVNRRRGLSLYTTLQEEIGLLLDSVDPALAEGRVTYWHCPLPHQPFVYDRHGRERPDAPSFPDETAAGPAEAGVLWSAYGEQIRYLDAVLARFLERLKASGLYEKAVIVLTSDHGLRTGGAMEPEGYPARRSGLVPRVPLILRAPWLSPGVSDVDYQHVDFAPTLLELLGIPYDPKDFEGRSALSGPRPPRRKSFGDRERVFVKEEGGDVWVESK